ncbi:MAG: FkbM family methyltransferase [Gammaproteobacteria bacterium]
MPIFSGPLRGLRWIPGSRYPWLLAGIYERRVQALLCRLVQPGQTVYDVGANVGFYIALAARLVGAAGRVLAFEPEPRNQGYLRRHLALNGMNRQVQVIEAAVAERSGRGYLRDTTNPAMGALAEEGAPVALVALDDFAARRGVRPPDLIKIDVEGAESRVLQGAARLLADARPALILAAHGWRQHEACWRLLVEFGYAPLLLRDGSEDGHYEVLALAASAARERRRPGSGFAQDGH